MKLSNAEKKRLITKYGPWAVVTGASSGIGLELAKCLAESGLNLVLSARRAALLQSISEDLKSQFKIDTRIVAADLSMPEGVQTLIDSSRDLPVGLLVASAGFGTSGVLADADLENEVNMLRVNVEAVLVLTHHFSRLFKQNQRGGIILLSSIVAFQGVPYAANYAASKAYIQSLAEALAIELRPHGVDVLSAAPGPVESGFGKRAAMQMNGALAPAQVSVPILKALGRTAGVVPGGLSKLLYYSLQTVPRWAKVRIMTSVMKGMTEHQQVS